MQKRMEYIDMVKGIGILGIIVMHSTFASQRVIFWLSSFMTPLFFLVSGMLIAHTKAPEKNRKEALTGRVRTLLLPFLYFSLFAIMRDLLRAMIGAFEMVGIWIEVNGLITLWGSSVFWFLPALFLSESTFILLRRKCTAPTTAVICLIMTVVSFFINEFLGPLAPYVLSDRLPYAMLSVVKGLLRAVYGLPFICAGYFLFEWYIAPSLEEAGKLHKIPAAWHAAGGIVLIAAAFLIGSKNDGFDFCNLYFGEYPILAYLSASIFFAGLVLACKNCPPFQPLIYFGKNSLIVMATHVDFYFLYAAVKSADFIKKILPGMGAIVLFFYVIGVVLVLEVLCITVINRWFPFLVGRKKRKSFHS